MELRQSTLQIVRIGPFLDSTDGVTPKTTLTITQADMQLSKDGAAFSQKNATGNAVHDIDGYYFTTFNVTDSNTTAILKLNVTVAGALPVWDNFDVVTQSYYDAKYSGTFNNLGGVAQTDNNNTILTTLPTTAEFNARTIPSANYFDFTSDFVQVGTNNDKTGYSISGTLNTLDDLENLSQTEIVTSGPIQTGVGAVVRVGIVENVNTIDDGAIKASTIEANALDDKGNWNIGKTGYQISGAITTLDGLQNISVAQIFAGGDIDGFTLEESHKILLSASAGKASGMETTTNTLRAVDDSKARITATTDIDGNRISVTLDASG